jgi:hypothetical protein
MQLENIRTLLRLACFAGLMAVLATPVSLQAQEFDLGGFVKSEYIYDTRQVVAARDGEFHLFPQPKSEVSDTDNLGGFTFFSRLSLGITDLPDALGAEVQGYFEADFFGPTNDEVSTFRLRRAFAKMVWDDREVLFGQEWSPLFTLASFPRTVATTTGAPFQPFARQPQVRLTLKPGNLRFIGAAAWQIDAFTDIPFDGVGGIQQQQRAGVPAFHGHVQFHGTGGTVVGAGAYFKALRPIITEDRFTAGAIQGYATVVTPPADIRAKATFGSDLTDHLMTGGYVYNPIENEFYPLDLFSGWVDINGKGTVAPGLYAGYLVNMGSADEVGTGVQAATRAPNIETLWRVAPRLAFNYGALRFALELEATGANYAASFDENYAPTGDTESVTNIRGNVTVFLFF